MKKATLFFAADRLLVAPWALPLLLLFPFSVLAQTQGAQNTAGNTATAQVRCEPRDPKDTRANALRMALQQQRQKCDDTSDANAIGRHLSTQEKAQLRDQLRQQR